jgi:cerevisin
MKLGLFASALLIASIHAIPLTFSNDLAPLYVSSDTELIANSYIVVLKDNLDASDIKDHATWIRSLSHSRDYLNPAMAGIEHVYDTPNLKGYSGRFDENVLRAIRQSDDVAFVEHNSMVYANDLQRNAPWGLSRISHVGALTFKNYQKYEHDPNAGEGVKVYVIDTGVNINHVDFEGRAVWGHTVPNGDNDEDGNGHGR